MREGDPMWECRRTTVTKKPYCGWPNCYWLTDGRVELVVTSDVGPRIIRLGFANGANVFREYGEMLGRIGDPEWLIYGGHRLWQAPEDPAYTYSPDNGPVAVSVERGNLHVTELTGQTTPVEKSIEIGFGRSGQVAVVHRLRNKSGSPIELAPWAITVMAEHGTAIVPLPPRGPHPENLSPTSTLSLWPYTDLSDARWTFGQRYILLRQDPSAQAPQKLGASVQGGWAAYADAGRLFVKTFRRQDGANYPDLGANVELFTNDTMLELETLGPLQCVHPGQTAEHMEQWFLFHDVPSPLDDADVDRLILPCVREAMEMSADY